MLGNINGIINSNGSYVVKYNYNAFGVPQTLIQSGYESNIVANNNPFLFKGYYYDDETGLYYCNYRYYYPLIARWISPDNFTYLKPTSLIGLNLYAYCENNPVMYVDEEGNLAEWVYWLIGGLVIVGSIALTIATSGATAPVLAGALIGGASGAFFGGADFSNGFSWDWENAAKGFAWGSVGGALSGAVDMGVSSLLSSSGLARLSTITLKFMANSIVSLGFSRFESLLEGEQWSFARVGTTFFLGGLGGLPGGGPISSIAWGIGFSIAEGGLGELFDYLSLFSVNGKRFPWWFSC